MPLYEYQCDACGQRFEVIQKFSDPAPDTCRKCGKGPVTRLMSSPAIQFKGSGWYITDYAQKGKSGGDSSSSKTESSAKTDSKSESKPESSGPDAGTKTESSTPASTPAAKE